MRRALSLASALNGAAFAAAAAWARWRVRGEAQEDGRRQTFAFGSAQYNQLGLGDGANRDLPTELLSLSGENVKQIAASLHASAAVTEDGVLYTWGRGRKLVLGHGDISEIPYPREVDTLSGTPIEVVSLSENVAAALDKNGRLYTWGVESLGREGRGEVPASVSSLEGVRIKSVDCGPTHVLAIDDQGKLYGWGSGYEGALGTGSEADILVPTEITTIGKVSMATCGRGFSLIVSEAGELYSCGVGDYGQTGLGGGSSSERYTRVPKKIKAFGPRKIINVSAGVYHAACVTEKGEVFTWGYGKDGQCGHGDRAVHSPIPRMVQHLPEKAVKVSCGDGHTTVLGELGNLYVFGRGRDGQLGRGDQLESVASYRTEPKPVTFFPQHGLEVVDVALGGDHSVVVARSNTSKTR